MVNRITVVILKWVIRYRMLRIIKTRKPQSTLDLRFFCGEDGARTHDLLAASQTL